MTDAYSVYLDCLDKVNKEENGYFPADLFNRLAWNASRHVFNDYQARLQSPQTAAAEKQKILDRLTPFLQRQDIAIVNGIATQPTDYAYFSNAKGYYDNGDTIIQINALSAQLCEAVANNTGQAAAIQMQINALAENPKFVAFRLLDNEQVARRLNSYIPGKRPSFKKPVMEREGGAFHVYPENNASVFFWYYRRPVAAALVMKPVPLTGDLVYDPLNSIPFEWTQEGINDVISKIAMDFGIYIREKELVEYSVTQKTP